MLKCPHGVKIPHDLPGPGSVYCSGCASPQPIKLKPRKKDVEIRDCPICLSEDFEVRDCEDFYCPRCGFDPDYNGALL